MLFTFQNITKSGYCFLFRNVVNCNTLNKFLMKKLSLLLMIVLFSTLSCTRKIDDILEDKITEHLKPTFKDPDSFKFVSLEYKTENVKSRKPKITDNDIKSLIGNEYAVEVMERMKTEKSFLDKQTDENAVAIYNVIYTAKGTNSFGAIIQNKYYVDVLADEDFTILKATN